MKTIIVRTVFWVLLFTTGPGYSASKCPEFYPHAQPIVVKDTVELCNSFFVTVYDTRLKSPIFSAEKFEADHTVIKRKDSFRPDYRLSAEDRAELSDFRNSGYDRGHMVPAGDSGSTKNMYDTFLLSNMTFQVGVLNQQEWRLFEDRVRKNAKGTTRVITGAIYAKNPKRMGDNGIAVPVKYYKCAWYTEQEVE